MTRPTNKRRPRYVGVKAMALALEASNGMIVEASKRLKCSHSAVSEAVKKHPALKAIVDRGRTMLVDLAEGGLRKSIEDGEAWAICFTLKCLGKELGYVERSETKNVTPRGSEFIAEMYRRGKTPREVYDECVRRVEAALPQRDGAQAPGVNGNGHPGKNSNGHGGNGHIEGL